MVAMTPAAVSTSARGPRSRRRRLTPATAVGRTLQHVLLVILALFCLIPFAWVVLAAIDGHAGPDVQLPTLSGENFVKFFTNTDTPRLLANSLIIAVAATAINLGFGVLGGYALARFDFPGRRGFMFFILLIRVVPAPATIVALYLILVNVHLDNTYIGLILVEATAQLPVTLWLLKGTISAIPVELEEASWMDGATRLQTIRRIVLPLVGPGLGASAMLTFMGVWGDFLTPLVLLQDPNLYPLSIGLFRAFSAFNQVDWGVLAASAIIYMVPPAVLYVIVRRNLLRSSLGGAVKG